ncbi:MAG: hypothetical protein N2321_11090 [Melioribacteraceae bacterium]|nr:hypothetical protein [Melioribacteraceae bacterium]
MKNLFFILFLTSAIFSQSLFNSFNYKNTSLDVVINPVSIAMGESFVANYFSPSSFIENPANLFQKNNTTLFYHTRSFNWISETETFKYKSVGGTLKLQIGDFGIAYNEFHAGKSLFNSQSDERNSTLIFSLSKLIFKNFNAGVNLKFFDHKRISDLGIGLNLESNTAILLDFGLLYSVFKYSSLKSQHEVTIGTTLQNFGTDYKEKDFIFSNDYRIVRLPRYFKIGFAYNLQFKSNETKNDFQILLTGNYKSLLNPLKKEIGDVDYWGIGTQIQIKEMFLIRIGSIQLPENNLLYDRAKPILRYGFGLNLPLNKFGVEIPLTISADYAFIPINQIEMYNQNGQIIKSKKTLSAAGITIRMNDIFFNEE